MDRSFFVSEFKMSGVTYQIKTERGISDYEKCKKCIFERQSKQCFATPPCGTGYFEVKNEESI